MKNNIFLSLMAAFALVACSQSNNTSNAEGGSACGGACAGQCSGACAGSCDGGSCAAHHEGDSATVADSVKCDSVCVMVFHGVKQCQTCEAIKLNSREVVEQAFAGRNVSFQIIDFSKDENKAIAEKYEVAWTSLILVGKNADGSEVVNNLSTMAIKEKNAREKTDEFRAALTDEIGKMLK